VRQPTHSETQFGRICRTNDLIGVWNIPEIFRLKKKQDKLYVSFKEISMKLLTPTLLKVFRVLFHHYSLHAPEHVGQFAGSLLPLEDWQHR
jgi:hypothetical protein